MKISIIMPSFNQGSYVGAALESVVSQDYDNWEVLFLDGGSTDDTMERIAPYRSRLAYCVSEPDKGQSDALHKGFMRATGDLMTWLNTDDLMLPGTLSKVARAATRDGGCAWILGNVVWIDAEDRILRCRRAEAYSRFLTGLGVFTPGGPSTFFSPALYERVGGVNQDLRYHMDTELWWRFLGAGARFRRVEGYTWALRMHEAAKTSAHWFQDKDDERSKRFAAALAREAQTVAAARGRVQFPWPPRGGRLVARAGRVVSMSYARGLWEDRRLSGRDVHQVFRPAAS